MSEPLEIACDEAGHTGPDLLHEEQRFFAYGSVAIPDNEAWAMIDAARRAHPVQMPELKAARLMRSANGRALISDLIEAAEGRFAVNAHEKLLALCGWVFEYIYEPVYQREPWLLYQKNLHRFVAMFTWLWFKDAGSQAAEAVRQFQHYMRTRDEGVAPLLFDQIHAPLREVDHPHPFELILRFARGYRDIIIADNARLDKSLPDEGRWLLDLSASGLWSHLNHWGQTRRPLLVRCDASKPLEEIAAEFSESQGDPGIGRMRAIGHDQPLGWDLAAPIAFVDSRDHPSVQLADIIASTTVAAFGRGVPAGFEGTAQRIDRHMLRDSIFPDQDVIDLQQRGPAVNYLVLYDLALRAGRGAEPYENLAEMYHAAEVSWARGDFNRILKDAKFDI